MGYKEAIEDGIKTYKVGLNTNYIVKCEKCGTELKRQSYVRGYKQICQLCKEKIKTEIKDINTNVKLKKLDTAIQRIIKQGNNIEEYCIAIDKIREILSTKNWFQSTEEIMVAIELYKNKVLFNHQVRVLNYSIDFVLPSEKIILEIDGSLFHNKLTVEKEKVRDRFILDRFDKDWEAIRIKDKFINQNIRMLTKALNKVKKDRQRVRSSYNGKLPYRYNDHCI